MRVGLIAILQESNTFLAQRTSLRHFRDELLVTGDAVRAALAGTHHEMGGFFAGLNREHIEPMGIMAARAVPYGTMTGETCDALVALLDEVLDEVLDRAGPLDGLLVAPHGATVSEREPDFDGFWLARLRERLGADVPIIGTLDPHANLSPRMVAACNALLAYRTNPHIDQQERGIAAAQLMARTLRGEIRPVVRGAFPPLAINIDRQLTSDQPCRGLLEMARSLEKREGVLSTSLLLGFPYADVPQMGSATLAVADGDAALAERTANALAEALWQCRSELVGRLTDIPAALDRAERLASPVCLLDMGDNVGGGSPGDGTLLAAALLARGLQPSFVCLYDPEAVQAAVAAGRDAAVRLRVGGKTDERHGTPLDLRGRVVSITDGKWQEPEPRHGGYAHFDQGVTAVVRSDEGLTVMLTSRRMAPFSLRQLTSCGVDAAGFRYLVAKGVHAPVAAYEPVCRHFVRVNTPGVTSADLSRFDYVRRRRPMFPFEPETCWSAGG